MGTFEEIIQLGDDRKIWEVLWRKGLPYKSEAVSPFLKEYSSKLKLSPPKRVFIPLCGNAVEIKWFYDKGYEVVGVDYIEKAVVDFFTEQYLIFKVKELPWGKIYETTDQRLKIYVADIFDVKTNEIGKFDILWVSGVLSSIMVAYREKLSRLLRQVTNPEFTFFLSALEFDVEDEKKLDFFPRPVNKEIVQKMFDEWCEVEFVGEEDVSEKMKIFKEGGINKVRRLSFLLTPKEEEQ